MELVAEGIDTQELIAHSEYAEGELRLYMDHDLTPDEVLTIENQLIDNGVSLLEPLKYDARILLIRYSATGQNDQIGFSPGLVVIAGLGIAGVLAWQLFVDSTKGVVVIAAVVGAVIALAWGLPRLSKTRGGD